MNFEVENRSGFGIIHCHVDLTPAIAPELFGLLNNLVTQSMTEPDYTIVFDLRHQAAIDATVALQLVKVGEALKKLKRALVLVHAPVAVVNQVGTQLHIAESETLFARNSEPKNPALAREAVIIEALSSAVRQTLLTLCPTLVVTPEDPFVKGKKIAVDSDIAAALSVKGGATHGTIVLAFPKVVYLAIMSEMHGEAYSDLTHDLQDGASELLNMIRSLARGRSRGYLIGKEIPEVSSGSMLQNTLDGFMETIVIPFSSLGATFYVFIGLSPNI